MSATKPRSHGATKGRKRRIAVVTGTRAEYGLLRSTMTALQTHRNVELQVVVTGSHLLPRFGLTVDEITADRWRIDARVPMQRGDDSPLDQAEGLARGVAGIAGFLHDNDTDVVVVLGDRIEAMAGALAAVTTGRMLAHIHGGDLAAGDFDDALRHSITKLAHLHFPATRASARRIIRMGESADRVFVVGAPGLDRIHELMDRRATEETPSRGPKRALVVQHPCGRGRRTERAVMDGLLKAVKAQRLGITCLYPNTDRGHQGILDAIHAHQSRATHGEFVAVPAMPRDQFLRAMRDADVLVGNSSSGILEAAGFGTPAVNVGPRQAGREPEGPGVLHCGESETAIRKTVARALAQGRIKSMKRASEDGRAGQRIADVLSQIPLGPGSHRKLNAY